MPPSRVHRLDDIPRPDHVRMLTAERLGAVPGTGSGAVTQGAARAAGAPRTVQRAQMVRN